MSYKSDLQGGFLSLSYTLAARFDASSRAVGTKWLAVSFAHRDIAEEHASWLALPDDIGLKGLTKALAKATNELAVANTEAERLAALNDVDAVLSDLATLLAID